MTAKDRLDISLSRNVFEKMQAEEILKWALDKFHPKIALASSFSAEDVVLIDIVCKLHPKPRIFTIDTGRLHQETYDLIDRVRDRYGVEVEVYFPQADRVEAITRKYGVNLFYRSVDLRVLCCEIRKKEPLRRALSGLDAWITGLRREQAPSRRTIGKVEVDEVNGGIVKLNPLADWTSDRVWSYIRENNVPYNRLYDYGYASIGCAPCTRPVKPGEDPRAGRWWWEKDTPKECGLHYRFEKGKFILET